MNKKKSGSFALAAAIAVPVCIVLFAALFASSKPDTLESLATVHNFAGKAKEAHSLFGNYSFPFAGQGFLSTLLAGLAGLVLIYLIYRLAAFAVKRLSKNKNDERK